MKKKTCVIYSAIHPLTKQEISVSEKKSYLSCKFWKRSKEEADLFYTFYRGEVWTDVYRVVGILSRELLNPKNFDDSYKRLSKAFDLYYFAYNVPLTVEFPKLKIIIDAIKKSTTYPKEALLDDVLEWARENKLINSKTHALIEKNILICRGNVFSNSDPTDEQKIQVIKLFISENTCIFYPDANALLFPDLDLLQEVKVALDDQKIQGFSSKNKEVIYLNMRSLIKWLMRSGYLPERYVAEFLPLKLESVKESKIEYQGKFDSLAKLVQRGKDRNELLASGKDGGLRIYLKYPRQYLHWGESSGSSPTNQSSLPECRYEGFGQLKRKITEDRHFGQWGGLTVDMLFFNETPVHGLSSLVPGVEYEIEFVPTKEEAKYGLQPYIKFAAQELSNIVSDQTLFVFQEEINLPDKLHENEPEVGDDKDNNTQEPVAKNRQHELRDAISRAYAGEKKKLGRVPTNTEVWKVVQNMAYDKDEVIQDISNEKIEWVDWKNKPRTMKRSTFNNFITKLNQE